MDSSVRSCTLPFWNCTKKPLCHTWPTCTQVECAILESFIEALIYWADHSQYPFVTVSIGQERELDPDVFEVGVFRQPSAWQIDSDERRFLMRLSRIFVLLSRCLQLLQSCFCCDASAWLWTSRPKRNQRKPIGNNRSVMESPFVLIPPS